MSGTRICASADLEDGGTGVRFSVLRDGEDIPAFAVRHQGRVYAWLNRCGHLPVELDWQPGEFFDVERRWILCSIHGAHYEPENGRCVAGPCGRGRLTPIDCHERDGRVFWRPTDEIRPVVFDEPATGDSGEPNGQP